jgi:hypothetical protein
VPVRKSASSPLAFCIDVECCLGPAPYEDSLGRYQYEYRYSVNEIMKVFIRALASRKLAFRILP